MGIPAFFAPRIILDRKARHGEPCTRCGLCCMATLCPLGQTVFGHPPLRRCPALEDDGDDRYECGLVANPEKYVGKLPDAKAAGMAAAVIVGAGLGCDARFNGEPADAAFYDRLREADERDGDKIAAARALWGAAAKGAKEERS